MTVNLNWTPPTSGGALDLANGNVVGETFMDAMVSNFAYLMGTTGTFITFTPTLTQVGSVSLTTATGRYIRAGSIIIASVRLVASSAGTGGGAVVIGGLPINATDTAAGGSPAWGVFQRSGGPNHVLNGIWASSSSAQFISGAASTGYFGTNPAVTVASGDELNATFLYRGG